MPSLLASRTASTPSAADPLGADGEGGRVGCGVGASDGVATNEVVVVVVVGGREVVDVLVVVVVVVVVVVGLLGGETGAAVGLSPPPTMHPLLITAPGRVQELSGLLKQVSAAQCASKVEHQPQPLQH